MEEKYKPIDINQTNELVLKAKNGDSDAINTLLNGNFPLIKSIVKTYLGKGIDYDDLYQIGCVGFLKAIKNFDPNFDVKFSTYAVPMISGEIKRFLRDDGSIKVSRSIKTLSIKIKAYLDKCKSQGEKTPTVDQIAKEFEANVEDVILALDSQQQIISLNSKVDEDDPNSQNVIDKLAVFDKSDEMIDKITLKNAIMSLSNKDRKIILLRYFRGKTQSEVATILDISQVQVSRMETKIIEELRKKLM